MALALGRKLEIDAGRGEGCSPSTAANKEGLAKKKILPLETRKSMFHRTLELRRLGYSYSRILKALKEEYGVAVTLPTISYWIRNCHNPYKEGLGEPDEDQRIHRVFNPCPGLPYVIGAVLGDGYTNLDRRRGSYMVILKVKDRDFAEEFGRWTATVLGREVPYKPRWEKSKQIWVVEVCSKELYYLLRKPIRLEDIRAYVEHCERCMAMFLRGLADAEGSVSRYEGNFGRVRIANTDQILIQYAAELLKRLGIESKIYRGIKKRYSLIKGRRVRGRRVLYRLNIHRKVSIRMFRDKVGFSIKRKQEILEMVR